MSQHKLNILLNLFLILVHILISHSIECTDSTGIHCSCTASEPCTLNCIGDDYCIENGLECVPSYPCTVHCSGHNACHNAKVFHRDASTVSIICDEGQNVCSGEATVFHCGYTDSCTIYCDPESLNSCNNATIWAVNTNQYECEGNCPNARTKAPTYAPTTTPTMHPSVHPSANPTQFPSLDPSTNDPTLNPTNDPTKYPSIEPTKQPTQNPSKDPTQFPTNNPTTKTPSTEPTQYPTMDPTNHPTNKQSKFPSFEPSIEPTKYPILYITSSLQMPSESEVIHDINSDQKQSSGNTIQQIIIISLSIICLSLCIIVVFQYRRRKLKDDNDTKPVHSIYDMNIELQNDNNMVNMIVVDDEVKEWLTTVVKLPQYFETFVQNGYHNLESIKTICNKSELEDLGIKPMGHKTRVIAKIKDLNQQRKSKKLNVHIRHKDIATEIGATTKYVDFDVDLMVIKFWLKSDIELPQYYDNFIQNEYNKLEIVADINNILQLNEIGITEEKHCIKILKAIELLQMDKEETEDECEGDIVDPDKIIAKHMETDGFMMEDLSESDSAQDK